MNGMSKADVEGAKAVAGAKASVRKSASGSWGFVHPFTAKWYEGFPTRGAARAARKAVRGAPDDGEGPIDPLGEITTPAENKAEVDAAFEAIIGVPRPEPVVAVDEPEPEPEPVVPAPAPKPKAPKPTAVVNAPNGYRLTTSVAPGYLRRDQPRKPGDMASYKVVEKGKATIIKTMRMATVKVEEAIALGAVGVDLEEVS